MEGRPGGVAPQRRMAGATSLPCGLGACLLYFDFQGAGKPWGASAVGLSGLKVKGNPHSGPCPIWGKKERRMMDAGVSSSGCREEKELNPGHVLRGLGAANRSRIKKRERTCLGGTV